MSASTTGRTQHPGLVLASMTLANAMVLVDQTAVPLTLAEIMRTYDVGSQKTVALVSAAFSGPRRGTALGTMGGIAAVAGAAGPVIRSGSRSSLQAHGLGRHSRPIPSSVWRDGCWSVIKSSRLC